MTLEDYLKELMALGIKEEDRTFLGKAFEFADKIHGSEKRLSGEPFICHPAAVSLKLAGLKLDRATVAAGLLHDTVEVSPEALKTIKSKFGEEVSFLVNGVTKVDRVHSTGADRALESVRKMFLAVAEDIRVVLVKLADRLHNMETLSWLPQDKQERIARETLSLYAPLSERLGMWNIKAELEDLSMRFLYPEEYKKISDEVKKRAPERERRIKKILPIIMAEFYKEGIKNVQISHRAKHAYSTWQKLERYSGDWSHISDLIAVRIILPNIQDCYSALGIIHKLWKPVPGRFKDYIALPKPNGYQSLHTSVFLEERLMVEFQIRTTEMHKEAETGIAAHWAYTEAGKPKKGFKIIGKKFNWVNQIQEWQKEFTKENATSEEILEALKIDFFKDRIFVLTPKGDVVDLPKSSTPIDFAFHIHSEVGGHASGAKINGRMAPFTRELQSGDVVEIITQKSKKPSIEWLSIARTGLAKNRIKRALRLLNNGNFLAFSEKPVEVHVYGKNRVGFIKDITEIFAINKVNILNLISNRSGNEEAPIRVTFIPKNHEEAQKIVKEIKKIEGVKKIESKTK